MPIGRNSNGDIVGPPGWKPRGVPEGRNGGERMDYSRKIPGWLQVGGRPTIGSGVCAQEVNGKWYIPDKGTASLQDIVDEWLEDVVSLWMNTTYKKDGKREENSTKTSKAAGRLLKIWGIIDEDGLVEWERGKKEISEGDEQR